MFDWFKTLAAGCALSPEHAAALEEQGLLSFLVSCRSDKLRHLRRRTTPQGAFIHRDGHSGTDFAARMSPETHARLGPLGQWVLGLDLRPGEARPGNGRGNR